MEPKLFFDTHKTDAIDDWKKRSCLLHRVFLSCLSLILVAVALVSDSLCQVVVIQN